MRLVFPDAKRDASSTAIMASALIELSKYSDASFSKKYLHSPSVILHTLYCPQYHADSGKAGGFLLKHNLGNMNANADVDAPLPYADYYYLEALMRYKKGYSKPTNSTDFYFFELKIFYVFQN